MKETLLSSSVTIAKYRQFEANKEQERIADFVLERFTERYITSLRGDHSRKHGFCIMAISCLMIESLESFWRGWPDTSTRGRSRDAFCSFFQRCLKQNSELGAFFEHADNFYHGVRCGILHQGETANAWRIRRTGSILNSETKTINATKFHYELEKCLQRYCGLLKNLNWDDEVWQNLRKKIKAIIEHCRPIDWKRRVLYFAYGSNMSTSRFLARIACARSAGIAYLKNKKVLFNKVSTDGSGKANLVDSPGDVTWGVLYQIDFQDLSTLDKIEADYDRIQVQVLRSDGDSVKAVIYISTYLTSDPVAYDWYKELVLSGAREHNLLRDYIAYLERLPSRPRR
jgi:gamma-glutamylcyclotransferase (GGCT)/AIG2-like uncharacterized protein YtfP